MGETQKRSDSEIYTEPVPVSETSYFYLFRIPDDGQSQRPTDSGIYAEPFPLSETSYFLLI
jgi:hypothetical protein